MKHWPAIAVALILAAGGLGCGDDKETTGPEGPPTDGLLAFYSFNANADDQSGNGNDGTLLGGASIQSGYLYTRANDTDVLSLPNTLLDGLTDFTVAAWVRIALLQVGANQFLSGANAGEDNAIGLWYSNAADRWNLCLDGTTHNYGGALTEDGNWHHVAVIRDGTVSTLYFDGNMVETSIVVSGDPLSVDPGGLVIGQDQDTVGGSFDAGESWGGYVENLRFYDRALSAAEVDRLVAETD